MKLDGQNFYFRLLSASHFTRELSSLTTPAPGGVRSVGENSALSTEYPVSKSPAREDSRLMRGAAIVSYQHATFKRLFIIPNHSLH